jgi:hypothetical protein
MGTEGDDVARLIEGRLEQHDRNQFEVKLDYTIDRAKAKNRYEVNAYFFLPKSLGVDAQTYPKAQFYSDIQAHIRFKTPGLSLQDLARTDAGDSPLGKILRSLDSPSRGAARPGQQARLSQELRLVGCLMRANLRDRVRETCRRLRALAQSNPAAGHELDLLRSEIQALVEEARCVLLKYRLLRTSFSPPRFEASLSETYQLVDEYMSLTVEGHLTRLLESLQDATAQGWAVAAETELLGKSILDERAHRRGFGHESLPAVEGGNETLVYRLGLLKKFVMSVLFLEITRDRDGHGTANFVAALAAGLAMLLATVGSIFVQTRYAMNTLPFVLALTLGYMAKDRVKEWAKLYLSSKMAPWLSDYRVKVMDPMHGVVVGSCRERVSMCGKQDLPPAVQSARHGSRLHTIEAQSKREIVVHYRKQITIYGRKLNGLDGQVDEINDIIRFSVSHFLTRMDDPVRSMFAFDEVLRRVREISCRKVYHLNVVFVLQALDARATPRIEHARVIMDRGGILRLESNDPASRASFPAHSPQAAATEPKEMRSDSVASAARALENPAL